MKHSSRNNWIGVLILILAVSFLFGCAAKTKPTPGEEKSIPPPATHEEMVKPEAKSAPEPSKQETAAPPSSPTTAPSTPSSVPQASQQPNARTAEIMLVLVNLRKGPGMNFKIIRLLKKGTKLTILEEKEGWLRVQLEDGIEGWVGKSTTSEAIQPSPAAPQKGRK